jgi:hypothetical protein
MRGVGRLASWSVSLARRAVDRRAVEAGSVEPSPAQRGTVHPAFDRALAQQQSRVFPERRREGIAEIGAIEADIGENVLVEAGLAHRLAAVAAGTLDVFHPQRHKRQKAQKGAQQGAGGNRQDGDICGHVSLHQVRLGSFLALKWRQARPRAHPEYPPVSSRPEDIALRGLISETNVFNLSNLYW